MKYRNLIDAAIVFTGLILAYPSIHAVDMSGSQLWAKVIGYHDPNGNWETFKGKVHLVSTYSKVRLNGEIIEIDKVEDFYQSKKHDANGSVSGVRKGILFASFDRPLDDSKEREKRLKQARQNALGNKQHHSGHIGMPMQMKAAGLKVENEVKLVEFQGKICYALTLIGDSDDARYDYWDGTWTLYVDPETYAMRGANREPKDFDSSYFECLGEFEVGGVKVQQVKNFYRSKDGSHWWTDVYANAK